MIRVGFRIAIVALILLGFALIDRSVDPPAGRGDSLVTQFSDEMPETPGVPFPGFATGFSVFLGAETDDFDYPVKTAALLDRLATLNVNSVAIVYSLFQDGPNGSEVERRIGTTPTDASLQLFIRAAHARGMSVMLRPTLDEENLRSVDRWRGQITPDDVGTWFETYGELIVHFAGLAETEQVASVTVGVELESMEQYHDQWRNLIGDVREVYSGLVTYSFNFQRQDIGFADALDFVGLDAYYPLDASSGATVEELNAAWRPAIDAMMRLQQATGKQIVLTEIGIASQANSFRDPFAIRDDGAVSQEDQRTYYESMCYLISTAQVSVDGAPIASAPNSASETIGMAPLGALLRLSGMPVNDGLGTTWQSVIPPDASGPGYMATVNLGGRPIFGGAYIWFAYLNALTIDPETDTGYPPFNKLAEPVLGQCYADRLGISSTETSVASPMP